MPPPLQRAWLRFGAGRIMRGGALLLGLGLVSTGWSQGAVVDLKKVDDSLANIAAHAKDYPPRFASAAERTKIEKELRAAIAVLDTLVESHPDDPELLLRDGFANAMGHNLDFAGCAQRSETTYQHLLALRPEDKEANMHYGIFLMSAARPKESLSYLAKAIELGATGANYSLAIAYLMAEDPAKAQIHLQRYVSLYPEDPRAKQLLATLESKNFKIEKKQEKSPAGR